jgi:tetratricopeptide (TPR) repeat protein
MQDSSSQTGAPSARMLEQADSPAPSGESNDTPRSARSRRRRRYAHWQDRFGGEPLATLLLGVLIVGAPQLLGGALPWAVLAITSFSLLCLGVLALRAPASGAGAPYLGAVMWFVLLWTALQALPLPCGLVHAIASESADNARASAAALGDLDAVSCALSRDPGATREEVLKGVAIVASFLSVWAFAASGGRRRALWLIAGSSLAMSVVALAHGVLDLERVFGLYTPVALQRAFLLAPLMNANNLGAFCALGVPLFIGLTYRDPHPNLRLLGYVAIATCSTACVLTLSRGAIGQLLASLLFIVFVLVARRRSKSGVPGTLVPRQIGLAAAVTFGLGAAAYAAGAQVAHELADTNTSKIRLIGSAFAFALQHAAVGVGRGAFSSTFVAHEAATARFVYPENFLAQWSSEWGVACTLLLLAALAVQLWHAARSDLSLARLSGLTALAALAAQNLVDFGFELLGVAVVAAGLLAACVAPSAQRREDEGDPPAHGPWRMRTLCACAGVTGLFALVLLGPTLPRRQVAALERSLRRAMTAKDRAGFSRELTLAVTLHPAEPIFALLSAAENIQQHDARAGRWLNRAMQLAPGWSAPHALAFKGLWQAGQYNQALLELRRALEIDPYADPDDVCRLARADPRFVRMAAPNNAKRRAFLEAAGNCVWWNDPASHPLDVTLLREYPDSIAALERNAWRDMAAHHTEEALATLDTLQRLHPEHRRSLIMRLQVELADGRFSQIVDEADAILPTLNEQEQSQVLSTKAMALARAGAGEQAEQAVAQVRRLASSDADRLSDSFALEARVHLELREPGSALTAFREAYRIKEEDNLLRSIAQLAEGLGDRPQALWAYMKLCQREPSGDACTKRNELLTPHQSKAP